MLIILKNLHQSLKLNLIIIKLLVDLNFSIEHLFQNGGPIIGIQLENEFAAFGNTKTNPLDYKYMQFLKDTLIKDGINSLFYTCDNAFKDHKDTGSLNGTLMTANFVTDVAAHLNGLKSLQPNRYAIGKLKNRLNQVLMLTDHNMFLNIGQDGRADGKENMKFEILLDTKDF